MFVNYCSTFAGQLTTDGASGVLTAVMNEMYMSKFVKWMSIYDNGINDNGINDSQLYVAAPRQGEL